MTFSPSRGYLFFNFNRYHRIAHKTGLPVIRFHDLRNTAATIMLLEGVHPKIVSERLGQPDVCITMNLYSHAVPSLHREAAKVLVDLLTPIPIEMSDGEFEQLWTLEISKDDNTTPLASEG